MTDKEKAAARCFGRLPDIQWDFKNKKDKKKCAWWDPSDWIPKYFTMKKKYAN